MPLLVVVVLLELLLLTEITEPLPLPELSALLPLELLGLPLLELSALVPLELLGLLLPLELVLLISSTASTSNPPDGSGSPKTLALCSAGTAPPSWVTVLRPGRPSLGSKINSISRQCW